MNTATRAAAPFSPADTAPRTEAPPVRGDFNVTFAGTDETFSALRQAEAWLTARGFSYGEMQRNAPIGVILGFCTIAKWFSLDNEEKGEMHGQIVCKAGSFRSGPVTVYIRRDAPHDVIEAFLSDPVDVEARNHVEGG